MDAPELPGQPTGMQRSCSRTEGWIVRETPGRHPTFNWQWDILRFVEVFNHLGQGLAVDPFHSVRVGLGLVEDIADGENVGMAEARHAGVINFRRFGPLFYSRGSSMKARSVSRRLHAQSFSFSEVVPSAMRSPGSAGGREWARRSLVGTRPPQPGGRGSNGRRLVGPFGPDVPVFLTADVAAGVPFFYPSVSRLSTR